MKDDIIQIAIRTLESGRVASAFCIGFLLFIFIFIRFSAYMPEISSTLGTPPLVISSGVAVICYSAGLIFTYAITLLLPKLNHAFSKSILHIAHKVSSIVSSSKLRIRERNAIHSALAHLTDNEKKFLSLLSETESPNPLHSQEPLPFMVYIAGQSLVRKNILTCLQNAPSHEKFAIQPKLKSKVERIVFNRSKIKPFIILDLNRVQGSQASGGGARASR